MAAAVSTRTGGPRLRADAVRNRERIMQAAGEAFVQFGPDVPLDEIARDAGVGNATLYRHFPDRESLVKQVVLTLMDQISERAEAAHNEVPDAFDALCRFVFEAAEQRVGALCPVLTKHVDQSDPEILAARNRLETVATNLMNWARRSGQLREDVGFGDVIVALTQLARPLPGTGCAEIRRFTHRHLQIFLDGLRAPSRSQLTGSAATFNDLRSTVPAHRV
ncbi:TetR/AcrR family transcriptional regulator [Streptomyces sp. N2-109]|uniref:TetR/AcrR family transcriptional regulator n=1 Tax=Streptomyces gossypii TaxID=2883101 RepID=A0ABT2JYZ1_9ACTN|nr:TetR/AcrR family transcriptional regulator [Streptomyces gossypii]MCT2593105.1 TetR/AcrR family transcriptional regulator [Streptomyces gossypii]